jgi:hypothetical protein
MQYVEYLVEQPQIYRLGLSLLHFLWQGAAVAMVVALITPALRRRSAALRYVVLLLALSLMALLPVATFGLLESPAAANGSVASGEPERRSASVVGDGWFEEETSLELLREAVEGDRSATGDAAGQREASLRTAWIDWTHAIRPFLPWLGSGSVLSLSASCGRLGQPRPAGPASSAAGERLDQPDGQAAL